jgi:hypothetical protein
MKADGGGTRTWTFGLNLPHHDEPNDVPRLLEHAARHLRDIGVVDGLDVLGITYHLDIEDGGKVVPGLTITLADDGARD